jgi:hypothetical protein
VDSVGPALYLAFPVLLDHSAPWELYAYSPVLHL